MTRELLASVDQMEDALKKRKQRAKAGGGSASSTAPDGGGLSGQQQAALSDSEKIKLQLLVDGVAFADELRSWAGKRTPSPPSFGSFDVSWKVLRTPVLPMTGVHSLLSSIKHLQDGISRKRLLPGAMTSWQMGRKRRDKTLMYSLLVVSGRHGPAQL